MNSNGNQSADTIEAEAQPAAIFTEDLPPREKIEWVDIRCCNCNQRLFLAADLSLDKDGTPRKLGIDARCRRCKIINYRIVVI